LTWHWTRLSKIGEIIPLDPVMASCLQTMRCPIDSALIIASPAGGCRRLLCFYRLALVDITLPTFVTFQTIGVGLKKLFDFVAFKEVEYFYKYFLALYLSELASFQLGSLSRGERRTHGLLGRVYRYQWCPSTWPGVGQRAHGRRLYGMAVSRVVDLLSSSITSFLLTLTRHEELGGCHARPCVPSWLPFFDIVIC